MNAMSKHDTLDPRQAVELERYDGLKNAIHRAEHKMRSGDFWSSYEGLDVVRAINDFLSGEHPQAAIEAIAGELPDTTTEEDSDPYFAGYFPEMRKLMMSIAPVTKGVLS